VLVEKPFANNAQDAAMMVAAATCGRSHLIEGFPLPLSPVVRARYAPRAHGDIGQIRHIEAIFNADLPDTPASCATSRQLGGGALMDLGVIACTGSAPWPATNRAW
jgi:predicted dehydrogenase